LSAKLPHANFAARTSTASTPLAGASTWFSAWCLPGNETRVQLCRDFFTPGGARYGYFHIALVKAPLAEIRSMAASFSSFPGG
jgi:hypothetical protein